MKPTPRPKAEPDATALPVVHPVRSNPYIAATPAEQAAMLAAIGAPSLDALFADIPAAHRAPELTLPPPLSEAELWHELTTIVAGNQAAGSMPCFLGGGARKHYVPSVVAHITGRSEFSTAYTPYQPEIAQGTLQTAFEFQSMVCELSGMDVANTSMYDGASALAEACLMAVRLTGRPRVALFDTVHPAAIATVQTYTQGPGIPVDIIASAAALTVEHACLAVQQPNFYGELEEVHVLGEAARAVGALYVVSADPLSLGLLAAPGSYGADIYVGDAQPIGAGLSFGGPSAGLFACRERSIRQMPGRIAGRTTDTAGRTGYVLTLQTREQHIRRERATSNICTSQQLLALAATVYLAAVGPHGLRHIAELCYHRAHYLAGEIARLPGWSVGREGVGARPFFCEFVARGPLPPEEVNRRLSQRGIIGGLPVKDGLLIATTELNPRAELDLLVTSLAEMNAT